MSKYLYTMKFVSIFVSLNKSNSYGEIQINR